MEATTGAYYRSATASLPVGVAGGTTIFRAIAYERTQPHDELLALIHRPDSTATVPLVRLHSACLTGDTIGSLRCDCGYQLRTALERIRDSDYGILLYLNRHEGRGIGLTNKIRAYALQDSGLDTVDANLKLGFDIDARRYDGAIFALRDLGVEAVRLLSNNPRKIQALENAGIRVIERLPILGGENEFNEAYLETKRKRMAHLMGGGCSDELTAAD